METKDLEEYLRIVVDLEKNIYMQEQLIKNLRQKISSLGIPKQFIEPVLPSAPKKYFWAPIGFLISFFIAIEALSTIVFALSIFFFFASAFWIGSFEERITYKKALKAYEYDSERYQAMQSQDQERLFFENMQKEMLLSTLQQLEERNKATKQTLADVYSLDIIYSKYRTFPQVCSLYEYIHSGRCTTLKEAWGFGSGGAYNLLEQEALQKTIILQLNLVLQQLNVIQTNQYMLYSAIQEGNQRLNDILSSINQISDQVNKTALYQDDANRLKELAKSSAITAYNTERIEKELSYMNRMNYFAGKYDDAGMLLHRPHE